MASDPNDESSVSRKDTLLRAAYDLIRRSTESPYVVETTRIYTHYDEADCDGYCLMQDISQCLGLDDDCDPIPLKGNG